MSRPGIECLVMEAICATVLFALGVWSGNVAFYAVATLAVFAFAFILGAEWSRSMWRPLAMDLLNERRKRS